MYPQIASQDVVSFDKYGISSDLKVAKLLQHFSRNLITKTITAGTTGVTVTEYVFVSPCKLQVTAVQALVIVPPTGSGNTPTVNVVDTSGNVAATGVIALSLANNALVNLPVSSTLANVIFNTGDIIVVNVINPTATITTPAQVRCQIEWESVA